MSRERKTIDCWEIHVCYDGTWENECVETNRFAMMINRRAYQENCQYPIKVVRKRYRKTEFPNFSEAAHSREEAQSAVRWFESRVKDDPTNVMAQRNLDRWRRRLEHRVQLVTA